MLNVKMKVIDAYKIGNRYFVRDETGKLKSLAEGTPMTEEEMDSYDRWYISRNDLMMEIDSCRETIKKLKEEVATTRKKLEQLSQQ